MPRPACIRSISICTTAIRQQRFRPRFPLPLVSRLSLGAAKALPGVSYNKDALKTILGDGAEIPKIRRPAGGSARSWFGLQTARHMSPLVQAFLAPFTEPVLILLDFREAQDILLRRNKEFDRASWASDALRGVNTPAIYDNAQILLDSWRVKAQLAGGRPFQADEDIHVMTFDIIKVVALGEGDYQSITARYLDTVRYANPTDQKSETTKDIVYVFPKNEANDDLRAHQTHQEAVGESTTHPFPKLFHTFHNLTAPMREAFALKISMLDKRVSLAVKQLGVEEGVKSALDYMIQREVSAAKKAGRQPVFDTPSMRDELYGCIGAGHDTMSTAFQWGLKHLAVHQGAQKKLRNSLRAAYAMAFDAGRQPSLAETTKTSMPYLDALAREAMVDTTLLRHRLPKGTQVFFGISGSGFHVAVLAGGRGGARRKLEITSRHNSRPLGTRRPAGLHPRALAEEDRRERRRRYQGDSRVKTEHGRLDVLINNAGLVCTDAMAWNKIDGIRPDQVRVPMECNYIGHFLTMHHLLPIQLDSSNGGQDVSAPASNRLIETAVESYADRGPLCYSVHQGKVYTTPSPGMDLKLLEQGLDEPDLCGAMCLWLVRKKPEWLSGRYLSAEWDTVELEQKRDEVVQGDKLKFKMVV
ncbi:hypothetical protein DL767_005860 [Monosporascus sp. MG133]|nr:hypothetical protein DL767_005860 [Monosporascus sp. MG133]